MKSTKNKLSIILTVVISIFVIAITVYATTTIGLNIDTGGNLTVSGNATTTGNYVVSGTLSAATTTITGAASGLTALNIATGDFAVNTNKFTITGSNGNTYATGTLGVRSDFAVNTDKFTVAGASGNTVIAGNLNVTGITTSTLASLLYINGTGRVGIGVANPLAYKLEVGGNTDSFLKIGNTVTGKGFEFASDSAASSSYINLVHPSGSRVTLRASSTNLILYGGAPGPSMNLDDTHGTITFKDSDSNNLMIVTDAGTTGNLNVTGATTLTGGATIGSGGTAISGFLATTTKVWDPASIADNAVASTTVTITGAALGNPCVASLTTATSTGDMLLECHISATNTARVDLMNKSGTAIDLDSGILKIGVFQF